MRKRSVEASVFEVDEHHRVLDGIQEAIVDGHFKKPGILINFDSHDDLALPLSLSGAPLSTVLNSKKKIGSLIDHVEISSWILPCFVAGIYDELIWITEYNTLFPPCTFEIAIAISSDDGTLKLVGDDENVPAEWREYWLNQYVRKDKNQTQWSCLSTFRITVCSRANFSAILSSIASSCKDISLSMDLDFFSTTNPARRSIPFSDIPAFRRQLIDTFSLLPMLTCNKFFDNLVTFLDGEKTLENVERIESLLYASLQGVTNAPKTGCALMFVTLYDLVQTGFRLKKHRDDLLQSLMQLALPEYKASWDEMSHSGAMFCQVLEAVQSRDKSLYHHILVARSELYTPKRQASSIRTMFLNLLEYGKIKKNKV